MVKAGERTSEARRLVDLTRPEGMRIAHNALPLDADNKPGYPPGTLKTNLLNEAIRIRLSENREREELSARLESMSPAERSGEQQIEFPIPEFVQPLAGGLGLRIACSDASAERKSAAVGLVGRLCREPKAVLEDILLAQQRDPGGRRPSRSAGRGGRRVDPD